MGLKQHAQTLRDQKRPSEFEMNQLLASGGIEVPPLNLEVSTAISKVVDQYQVDGILDVKWGRESSRFAFECKSQSSPRIVANAVAQATRAAHVLRVKPMVIVPFLSEKLLSDLEIQAVSGIDLCGNALVLGDKFRVLRTGKPNRFTSSAPIKNVFRGTSSLIARCFLIKPSFQGLTELRTTALGRAYKAIGRNVQDTRFSKGTVSKVVQALADELIVDKAGELVQLVDVGRLLSALKMNFVLPSERAIEAKTSLSEAECWKRLQHASADGRLRFVATGIGSAPWYGVLSIEQATTLYVDNAKEVLELLEAKPTRLFPNLKLFESASEIPYFDARKEGDRVWASPIQTWIELATGGPRERDAATVLEKKLTQGQSES